MNKFTLEIDLDNPDVRTYSTLHSLLQGVASHFMQYKEWSDKPTTETGDVEGLHGSVGTWSITTEADTEVYLDASDSRNPFKTRPVQPENDDYPDWIAAGHVLDAAEAAFLLSRVLD
jgi:hypothetical protein